MKNIFCFALILIALCIRIGEAEAQIVIGGDPLVNPDDFVITTFAGDLNYPLGMAQLTDGSILVAVSNGTSFFGSSSGSLIRLVDSDDDGIADSQIVLVDDVPDGGLTSLRVIDNLIFTTGQGKPITIYRFGTDLTDNLIEAGSITIHYSGSWRHPHSALAIRSTPGQPDSYDLFFQLGSSDNFTETTRTLPLTSTIGVEDTLNGDALYIIRITDNDSSVVGSGLTQIATGLRNAAGMAFHPITGDLYFEDNGIDGLTDPNEPHSADELNIIPADQIGGEIEDFGFPDNYTAYRTDEFVGGGGISPLVAFQPIGDLQTGDESEGPNDIVFAPPGFPEGLNNGVFVGFHGKFSLGGLLNEENPLVYVDLNSKTYFHFIDVKQPNVGHLDGLLMADSSLFIADLSPGGDFNSEANNSGVIYQIRRKRGQATGVEETVSNVLSSIFVLSNAWPNPFNPSTEIAFSLKKTSLVSLKVYNATGQLVKTLFDNAYKLKGYYRVIVNMSDQPSGVYFYRLQSENRVQTKKMILLK